MTTSAYWRIGYLFQPFQACIVIVLLEIQTSCSLCSLSLVISAISALEGIPSEIFLKSDVDVFFRIHLWNAQRGYSIPVKSTGFWLGPGLARLLGPVTGLWPSTWESTWYWASLSGLGFQCDILQLSPSFFSKCAMILLCYFGLGEGRGRQSHGQHGWHSTELYTEPTAH